MEACNNNRGFVLITTLFMMSVLLALLGAYFMTSNIELATTRSSHESTAGFFSAEGGLNVRAEEIRETFLDYNRPEGTSPSTDTPCESGDNGSGHFSCATYDIGGHDAVTYVIEDPSNPIITTIPPGELYQNLNAQEYRYTVNSEARGPSGKVESILELRFKSRLVPLFQFVAFYDKDLEILPGPEMTLNGPIHTNGDLYLNTENGSPGLTVNGQITTAGDLYRGRKNVNQCLSNPVRIYNPTTPVALVPSCSSRTKLNQNQLTPWNGMIHTGVDPLVVPKPEVFDPVAGALYWDKADLRLVLALNSSNNPITTYGPTGVQVRNLNDSVDAAATAQLHSCSGTISSRPIGTTASFYNNREGTTIRMLEVDMRSLLSCLHTTNWFGSGKQLSDSSDGGIVFHFTVKGPNSGVVNNYGVRIRNADQLQASVSGAPAVKGMSIISNQAVYTRGHYNRTNKIPAAIMCDSFNVLSEAWNFGNESGSPGPSFSNRVASNTTINTALLSGTDTTGGPSGEGEAGQGGAYNGGLENYPRFHENWSGRTLTYRGSFVSLTRPRYVDGLWIYGSPYYNAPNRNWDYDTSFNNAANLPPLTPRFVYLRQELFVRDYEQD